MKFKAGEGVLDNSGNNRVMAVALTTTEAMRLARGLLDKLIGGKVEKFPGASNGVEIRNPVGDTFVVFVDFPERSQHEEIDSDDVDAGNPEWLQNGFSFFGQ